MKSTEHLVALQKLVYQNIGHANIGDATGLLPAGAAGSFYAGLHSAWTGLAGNQTTSEASYSGYARQAAARSSGGFTVSAGGVVTLTAALTFPTCGVGASGTLLFWTLGTALSSTGHIIRTGGLGGLCVPCTLTTADVVTSANLVAQSTGLTNGDRVAFWALGGTVPAGLTEGTAYYVISVSGNTFSVSATLGGSAVDITANGACYVQRLVPITLAENVQPILTTSTTISDS